MNWSANKYVARDLIICALYFLLSQLCTICLAQYSNKLTLDLSSCSSISYLAPKYRENERIEGENSDTKMIIDPRVKNSIQYQNTRNLWNFLLPIVFFCLNCYYFVTVSVSHFIIESSVFQSGRL